jgi:hypothetical protein
MAVASPGLVVARRRRRWPVVPATALAVAALWPVPAPSGPTEVAPGVEVCGEAVVLARSVDVVEALEGLQRAGVVRADVVVGPPSDSSAQVAEQLGAVLRFAPPEGPAAASEAPCTVAP